MAHSPWWRRQRSWPWSYSRVSPWPRCSFLWKSWKWNAPWTWWQLLRSKKLEFLRSVSLWLIDPSNYRGLFGVVFVSVRFDPVCHLMEEWTWQELKYMINWSNKKDDRDFQYMKIYDVIMYNSQVDPIFPLGPRIPKRHFPQGLTTESGVAALAHLQDYSMGLEYDLPAWKPSI